MKRFNFGLVGAVFMIGFVIAAGAGWVWNIAKLIAMDGFSGMMIGRIAGIFIAPLGAVLGYF